LTRSLRRRDTGTDYRTTFGGQTRGDPSLGTTGNVHRVEALLAQERRGLMAASTKMADDEKALVGWHFGDSAGHLRQGNQPGTDGANFVEFLGLADID
jgi:hypothetical protein